VCVRACVSMLRCKSAVPMSGFKSPVSFCRSKSTVPIFDFKSAVPFVDC
jgi:hypothetical protein